MKKIAIAVHGGAGPDSKFIQEHQLEYKLGIQAAIDAGYMVLQSGGSSVDAVEAAVKSLEDNPIFNAGKGAALNENAEVEMCSSIMEGSTLDAGAVAILKGVKNPVSLAKAVMQQSRHIFLGGEGAVEFARLMRLPMEREDYFITDHAYEQYIQMRGELQEKGEKSNPVMHGTVGAVALDQAGNIAAATSTGGTEYCNEGRIADSSMAGVGTYANNQTCAVSTTGDGEYHIKHVSAFHVAALVEYKQLPLQKACTYLIHEKCGNVEGDMGLIALDASGNIAMAFNSERMHRGWKTNEAAGPPQIY
ncbi:MAG TPA: isoaspartyl peptidase/L-asparaginase [Chitinophagaceae bacterium]|jgi:beta-aspartyl-peptidase (threonine type)|nr:isoaspartyl peptidase/L-asparaginase [Chitinophagaceae bacterium]